MHRVSLVQTVIIQPEQTVYLVFQVNGANLEGIEGVLEPMDKFFERFSIVMPSAPSLVNEGSVLVRFNNYFSSRLQSTKTQVGVSSVHP